MPNSRDFDTEALPHIDAAYNLAYWLTRNSADAQDVVQDAYLRAFKAFGQFQGGDIRPWLLTIVRNVAYRWLSVRKRNANVVSIEDALGRRDGEPGPAFEPASDEPSAEDVLISDGERTLVRRALAELTPAFRELLTWSKTYGSRRSSAARPSPARTATGPCGRTSPRNRLCSASRRSSTVTSTVRCGNRRP